MSIGKAILYTSETNPSQKVSVSYTCNDDLTETSITDYTITGVSDAKNPQYIANMEFKDAYVDSDATLVSAVGFLDGTLIFSAATGQVDGEKNAFGYLSTDGTFKLIEPCTISVT